MSLIAFISNRRRTDERGATAIVFALAATVMLGAGALAVDVGQVYTARAELQQAVDKAVVAAASQLDGSAVCSDAVKAEARKLLAANWPRTAGNKLTAGSIPLDGTAAGGTITCTKDWTVVLTAPTARVDYALARAVTSATGVDVPAEATAGVYSPKSMRALPAYATRGCTGGYQVLFESPGTKNLPVDGNGCAVERGNFGGLKLPRAVNQNENAELTDNIRFSPDFSLAKHPVPSPDTCGPSTGVVSTQGALQDGTNCVDTLRGYRSNAAHAGFIGTSTARGLLAKPTSSRCITGGYGGIGPRSSVDVPGASNGVRMTINNDRLECFLTSVPAGGVGALASDGYSGGEVLDPSLLDSPRFVWVPLIGSLVPDESGNINISDSLTCNGSKCNGFFRIQGFKPGFIMGPNPTSDVTIAGDMVNRNGLFITQNRDLSAVQVFLFNERALPPQTYESSAQTYIGVGPKVVRLID